MPAPIVDLGAGPPGLGLPLTVAMLSLGWFVGSFPSAVLVGRAVGVDVLHDGERNPGAANVWKLAGPEAGLTALVLDFAKVLLPGLVGWGLGGWWGAWAASIGAVLGSMRPLTRRIRGGRGIAAGGGACIVLQPLAAAIAVAGLGIVYWARRSRVLALATAFTVYPAAFTILSVRSLESAWPLAGIGTLYLLLVARYVATRPRPGTAGPVPHGATGRWPDGGPRH